MKTLITGGLGFREEPMNILIAGYGFIGKETHRMLLSKYGASIYDPPLGYTELKPFYDICFICVPTPQKEDGSCDDSLVYQTLKTITADVYVCLSTIPPHLGLPSNVVFQPEYSASSSPYPAPLANILDRNFIILGGEKTYVKKIRRLYETIYPPTTKILEVSSSEARMIKYMANSFAANYVSFCNEFYDMCQAFGIDYDKVREGFLLDPRMTPWWTYVYPNKRGWGGDCLPKDTSAIVCASDKNGYSAELLKAIRKINANLISAKRV
jgi:UDPglucose 6-dehydrogenase